MLDLILLSSHSVFEAKTNSAKSSGFSTLIHPWLKLRWALLKNPRFGVSWRYTECLLGNRNLIWPSGLPGPGFWRSLYFPDKTFEIYSSLAFLFCISASDNCCSLLSSVSEVISTFSATATDCFFWMTTHDYPVGPTASIPLFERYPESCLILGAMSSLKMLGGMFQ